MKRREVRKDASKYETGMFGWKRGGLLAWIQFFNEDTHEIIYEPTFEDIEKAATKYNIDPAPMIQMIASKDPDIMGFVIDVEQYRKSH